MGRREGEEERRERVRRYQIIQERSKVTHIDAKENNDAKLTISKKRRPREISYPSRRQTRIPEHKNLERKFCKENPTAVRNDNHGVIRANKCSKW